MKVDLRSERIWRSIKTWFWWMWMQAEAFPHRDHGTVELLT